LAHFLFGACGWTKALGVCALAILAGGFYIPSLVAFFHQRFWYERILRKRYAPSYAPRCSIILPCKGIPDDFESNLKAFLDLNYAHFEIIFAVESESDPAYKSIKSLIAPYQKASVVVAGHATQCGQKNFNQLAAIKSAKSPDVYVFADADICPQKQWLKELILPLSSAKVTAVTGFRWNVPLKETMGEYVHTYLNIFLYIWMTSINFCGGSFLWGGSMAMRKKDFDDLKVADCWGRSVVDDNSLSRLLMKKLKRTVVVPACITSTDELLNSVRKSVRWFARQIMYLKAHEKPVWFFGGVPLAVLSAVLFAWLPVSFIASRGSAARFADVGGGAALVFYVGGLGVMLFFSILGPIPRVYKMFLFEPFLRATILLGFFRTSFAKKILWSGIKYHLTFSGKVSKVERMGEK
jgi:cellulose synthase/poly-beta-1,6-N-acetylglucosamine synthase-like glycosyltransferase